MREVISRRLKRLGGTDPSFCTAPDLIVVDGGKGQLSAALSSGPFPPGPSLIAFSENDEIFTSEKNIKLDKHSYALRLLQRIRDEAHRFAGHYQKTIYKRKNMR